MSAPATTPYVISSDKPVISYSMNGGHVIVGGNNNNNNNHHHFENTTSTTILGDGLMKYPHNRATSSSSKHGKIFCNCCDMRRAVIIVNIFNIIFITCTVALLYVMKDVKNNPDRYNTYDNGMDDGTFESTIATIERVPIRYLLFVSFLHIWICMIGITGAIKYKPYLIGFAGLMYLVDTIVAAVHMDLLGIFLTAFFAYPHFILMSEIKHGIMSSDTYSYQERYSCCC